jgi:pleiotropic regulator 1
MTQNKVIRDYHAHLSGGYCVSILENQGGPNILVTGGRDSVARVWDIRTAAEVAVLVGHNQTVASIACQMSLPQVITGSHDQQIKLWDLRKTSAPITTLTHHKKSVRALQIHPTEYTFISGAGDNLKVWQCPTGTFLRNLSGHNATINALAMNRENVLVSGADNGSLNFWDYKSGHAFQTHQTTPQPGSLDAESGIFAMTFDQTGSRLLTGEADKSIKVYKEDENATEETHPLNWKPGKKRRKF